MHTFGSGLPLVGLVALATACGGGSGGGPAPAPLGVGVHSLGLETVLGQRFDGEWIVAGVPERGTDLNGDGDAFDDVVLAVIEARTGRQRILPWAVRSFELGGGFASFVVPEASQGQRDLNRDGDALDDVLFVHELRTGATRNLGLALERSRATFQPFLDQAGSRLAFAVSEHGQGESDLDGDGQVADAIAHVLALPGRRAVSLGLPLAAPPIVSGTRVLLGVRERGSDWNGDGDRLDQVLFVHDTALGTTRNLERAVGGASELRAELDGELLAFLVAEREQGGVDLNGDGNPNGSALEIHDLAAGTRVVPQLVCYEFQVGGGLVLLWALEEEPGGFSALDLNADGDVADRVAFVHDQRSGILSATGLAGPGFTGAHQMSPRPALHDRRAAFLADEVEQGGSDLDGDGDAADVALQVFDGASGRVEGTVHEVGWGFDILALERENLVFPKPDARGDQLRQAFAMEVTQGTAHPLGYSVVRMGLQEGRVLLWVPELAQGEDLDGDGRLDSTVLLVHSLATGQTFDTKLAFFPSPPWGVTPVLHGDLLVVDVYEPLQGEDLNGDLDVLDSVLVLVRLP